MRNFIIIIVCIVLGFILWRYVWNDTALVINKHYKYFGCNVTFKHAILIGDLSWQDKNWLEEENAKRVLMKCLCDKYETTKDSALGDFIIDICNSDNQIRRRYVNDILLNTIDTSVLVMYCKDVFKDNTEFINKLNVFKDRQELKKIVIENIFENYNSEFYYNQLIHRLPIAAPKIDTVLKYREVIFEESLYF